MTTRLRGAAHAVLGAMGQALGALPALVVAWLCLRVAESIHAGASGMPQSTLFGAAVGNDALALLRHGFLIMLGALPLALLPWRRARAVLLGLGWSVLLCLHAALLQYQWTSGVPLGADLFAYSRTEIAATVAGAGAFSPLLAVALALALAVLWTLLLLQERFGRPHIGMRLVLAVLAASTAAFALLPGHFAPRIVHSDAELNFVVNKSAWFGARSLAWLAGAPEPQAPLAQGPLRAPWEGSDARYPFLRPERTPDTLGPLFNKGSGTPPNLVFIIVEGLGRTFSGPGARLGSFTPFLDELAQRGLYFENFLAGQGRTFGVLTTMFGSLPFGDSGLAALGERLPRHDSLISVLKRQGYRSRFYTGTNIEFDNEGKVMRALGVDGIVGERDFDASYQRSNEWGYADRDLVRLALARERKALASPGAAPYVSIIQTTGMHTPFTFPGQDAYRERVARRVEELKLPPQPAYSQQRDVFASILYLDDALRLFFEQAATLPGYDNTIFVITGDHRLPELPMQTRIERYHVPLIVYSPLLKAPRAIKSVSSQFDLAPSLLAYLASHHGLATPEQVTWVGTGLDTEPAFRNLHAIPLKQTRADLHDFVSGTVFLSQDRLYTIADGMQLDRLEEDALLARTRAQFASFLRANALAGKTDALAPDGIALAPYGGERTLRTAPLALDAGDLGVASVRVRPGTGALTIEAVIANRAPTASRPFVPLLVVTDANGRELGESSAAVRSLAPGESVQVALRPAAAMTPGVYYVAVIPAHPETGRPVGTGKYHVRVQL